LLDLGREVRLSFSFFIPGIWRVKVGGSVRNFIKEVNSNIKQLVACVSETLMPREILLTTTYREMKRIITLILTLSVALGWADQPNFVVIFTDDQGYGDLGCFGGEHVETPRIDQMAAEGAKLTSFYVSAPYCTPSRAALMTGCYHRRIDMGMGSRFFVTLNADRKGLNPKEITIAEVLGSVGYRTGIFGKWHLGDQPEFLPTRQGFEEFFGLPYSHDIHPYHPAQDKYKFPKLPLLEGETVIEMEPNADLFTQRITERAVSFIERHKEEPFFLYVPHPLPHVPLHVSEDFMEGVDSEVVDALAKEEGIDYKLREKLFKECMSEIDWSVGRILDTLTEAGISENTIVIFTSDNGAGRMGTPHNHSGPLRGRKGSTLEGGVRMPTVIRWPAQIKAGQENDTLMTTMDLLPTFAKLAGAEAPTDRVIDGKDITACLVDGAETPHEAFYYGHATSLKAIRYGDWKYHLNQGKPNGANTAKLYNLKDDIGESKNVISLHPELVEKFESLAKAHEDDLFRNSRSAGFVDRPVQLKLAKQRKK